MATCNISELLEAGKCFACLPPNQLEVVELQLLCEILAAGGGGGGGQQQVFQNEGDPEGIIFPESDEAICIDTLNNIIWNWYNNTWHH